MGEHREQPSDLPQLPFLDITEWLSKHTVRSYWETPSDGHIATGLGITAGLEILGHTVEALEPVTWIHLGWEILESWSEAEERPQKAKEAQLEAWNVYMWEKFWTNESACPSRETREASFDALVGDNANHGIVPELTKEAEAKREELIFKANERWLEHMQGMLEAKKDLEYYGPKAEAVHQELLARAAEELKKAEADAATDPQKAQMERHWAEWARDAVARGHAGDEDFYVNRARETMNAYQEDLKKVLEFEANPANWDLTQDQRQMLHGLTSEMPVNSSQMPPSQTTDADPAVSDGAEGIYDVVGGRPD